MFGLIEYLQLNVILGAAASLVFLLGLRGIFVHVLHPERREAFHLIMLIVVVLGASVGRTTNWDLLRVIIGDEAVDTWRALSKVVQFNAIINALLLWSVYHLHRLLYLLLPLAGEVVDLDGMELPDPDP
ncbi:hypothetical protein [Pseudooceanicola sp.]|uniref:hypothetical protein n=1 Tax=Pseudooceanicola sp. TaxID=1914328 RepID=UPI00351614B2